MKNLKISILYTLVTTVVLGILYPMAVTGLAHLLFPRQADGEIIAENGVVRGSRLIGQPFSGAGYFHSRPSAAASGYDAAASSGSNLGPTSKALADRVKASVSSEKDAGDVPVDLVTASGSGLDPDISPAAAFYQVQRVAGERHVQPDVLRDFVRQHVTQRQWGLLGEPRVNVLELNLDLDRAIPR